MSSSGTESDSSASSDVDFNDYGEFGYQLEPEYTEEELRQMEEAECPTSVIFKSLAHSGQRL
jgi:hypothetical protein